MWHCKIDESTVNNMMDTGFSTPAYQFNANKIKETTEPIQEAIYDFGGANVKSCASIALNKSISKGLIPPGTKLPQQWATTSNIQQQNPITSPSTKQINKNSNHSFPNAWTIHLSCD